jgi:hypothetical protein
LSPKSSSTGPGHRAAPFTRAICIVILLAAIPAGTPFAQQSDGVGNLVFSLNEAIIDVTKTDKTKPRVRVESFRDLDGDTNALGVELANQVSDLLRQASATSVHNFFYVLDRISDTSPDAYNQPCDEKHTWPNILVNGSIDELAGRLSLRVTANRTSNTVPIFDRIVLLPMDPTMESAMAKRLIPVGESEVWLRPGYDPDKDIESKASRGDPKAERITPPSCVYCPRTDYTDGALKAQIQGEITMRMLVSKHGDPLKIVVVQGLPCGLNRAALETVGRWSLNPAKSSDGNPVEVWQQLEITLQLY